MRVGGRRRNYSPYPIHRFVEATNATNTEAVLATFADDAFLSDWGRSFQGRAEIARWNQSDNIGAKSHLSIVSIAPVQGTYRVRIAVKGKGFNGEGDMTFTLDGDRIASLVIT
ncbi:nuclear transport factor 2 family protein [Mesorhizobium carmichaelinearum]|uniref:nuclear transport factor 2 family protein n=1 Tax=Mesorhizobium carmichaelinearum TaxID=1208188 RepID=UPI000BA2FD32|nr:nuclear transport factor 2 family protein [Mesorhizobium carmichaelinearum]